MARFKPTPREPDSARVTGRLSLGKRRLYRVLAAALVPVVLAIVLEITLRLGGVGYPTAFFLSSTSGPAGALRENPRFGWRFFPVRLARAPDPIRVARQKAPGTCRIFVLGESAALGDPEPAYGFSRILRVLLEERCPEKTFEIVNVALTAINSHAILPIARDCARLQGDIWIIYMGNNEVVGPFGAGSVFGAKAPPLPLIRANLAAKTWRLGQVLDRFWQRLHPAHPEATHWEGMKMMRDEQFRADDPLLQRVYHHFARNLEAILATAARAGIKPIVCSVSSNLKDCPPFASRHRRGLSAGAQAEWAEYFQSAAALETNREFARARDLYQKAAAIDGTYAELSFRMARCYAALGEEGLARQQFEQARDLDVLRFRADRSINQEIRAVCQRRSGNGVRFFDSEAALNNAAGHNIPGAEYFWDHVHFNFRGNYLIAQGLADKVIACMADQLTTPNRTASAPWSNSLSRLRASGGEGRGEEASAPRSARPSLATPIPEGLCRDRLAYTDWDERAVVDRMWRRFREPPFTDQLDHEQVIAAWSAHLRGLEAKVDSAGMMRAKDCYREALQRWPDDWVLHHRFSLLLENAGDLSSAERECRQVLEAVPGYVDAIYKLGELCARTSRFGEAEQRYNEVLRLRPDSVEAMNSLGLLFMSQSRPDEALAAFTRAIQVEPTFSQARVNMALILSQRGQVSEAERLLQEALRSDPDSAAAHVNLANLLATQAKHVPAIEHYTQALQLRPKEATVHLGLANSLLAVGRDPEAVASFQTAIQLRPDLAEAHFNLGVALARRGQLPAATRSFEEAVRLAPRDAQAHLNLGVALAKQNRLAEATAQFQEVLRLNPSHALAKQYLEKALAREATAHEPPLSP